MAFPVTPLPFYAGIAAGADPAAPETWSFSDITTDVREYGKVVITTGRQDEQTRVDATDTRATFNNTGGKYCRVNPLSTLYGQLDKGSPVEYRVMRINDQFTRSVGSGLGTDTDSGLTWTASAAWAVSSNAAQAPLATANLVISAQLPDAGADDVEVSTVASLSAVTTGANWVHAIQLRYSDANNFYRMHTEFDTAGVIQVKIAKHVAGVQTTIAALTSSFIPYSAGTKIRTRARAIGSTLQLRVWADGQTEPSTWLATVEDDDLTGQTVGLWQWRVVGNTNPGTVTCTIDEYRVDAIRASTPVPEWPVRWDMSGNDVTAPIVGAGILRRLTQGSSALRSPIYRQLAGQPGCGYWPLEDGSGATAAASAIAQGVPAVVTDGSFGSTDCPPGAASALTLNTAASSKIVGKIYRWTVPTDGYAVMCYLKLGSAPGVTALNILEVVARGTVARWLVQITNTTMTTTGYDGDGIVVVGPTVNPHGLTTTSWFALQLEAQEVGGNVNWATVFHQVGGTAFLTNNGSFAGTADLATIATVYAPVANTLVSHLWAGDDLLPFVDNTFMQVSAGYAGETAGARLARLATQEGVPMRVFGDPADTAQMGVQGLATFVDLVRACEAADQGVLFEAGAGLGYLTHAFRQNPPVAMALDFDSGHLAAPPEPVDDDQRLRNQIKLSRTGGSEVTVQDDASIVKSGTYVDELEVSLLADGLLTDHAGWRLHMGTFDDLRWPKIELDLAGNPSLIPAWCRVRVGSRITIANPPGAVGTATLDLIVEGWTETLGPYTWGVILACSPASLWRVGVFDDTTSQATSASSSLVGQVSAGMTSLKIGTWNPKDIWSTTGTPYDLEISGEQVTVTSMGAAGSGAELISGSFETGADITAWGINANCTLALSSTFAHSGTNSGRLTVVGTPTQAYIRPSLVNQPQVLPGFSYTLTLWVRSAVNLTDVRATIDWLDSNGTYLSSSDSGAAGLTSAAGWVQRTVTATAPANAAYAQYGSTVLSSPAAGTLLYTDDVTFTAAFVKYQTATVTRAVNGISKTLPARSTVDLATPVHFAL